MNLLTSSVVKAEDSVDFADIQLSHVRAFRAEHPDGERARVSQGLVVIPTDSATPEQRVRYEEYAAKRLPRTAEPQGPGRLLFAPDLVGSSAEIAGRLYAHAAFREIDEVAFALPFTFEHEDYVQILTDIATKLGPELGWSPTEQPGDAALHAMRLSTSCGGYFGSSTKTGICRSVFCWYSP